jgi:hypothetical protein
MVRIKERYLLVNIVYPPDAAKISNARVPGLVAQHQPTVEKLTPQALVRAIRAEVSLLYGDYGAGALEGNLSGEFAVWSQHLWEGACDGLVVGDATLTHAHNSQISVSGDFDLYSEMQQGTLSTLVVDIDVHGSRPG